MSIEAGLVAFAALASLAFAMRRHRADAKVRLPLAPCARIAGWSLLLLSAILAIAALGPGFGVVAWIGQLGVAAVVLVLVMSWRPQVTPALAIGALVLAAPLLVL